MENVNNEDKYDILLTYINSKNAASCTLSVTHNVIICKSDIMRDADST